MLYIMSNTCQLSQHPLPQAGLYGAFLRRLPHARHEQQIDHIMTGDLQIIFLHVCIYQDSYVLYNYFSIA